MRLPLLFPLACYLTAFILGMLCLFAGRTPGFLEDHAIIRLNVSSLGYDLISNNFPEVNQNGGGGGLLGGLVGDITGQIEGILNNIGNDVANKLASDLGIEQWYSLHIMSACQGNFVPNATSPVASLNVTECSGGSVGNEVNITSILDHQLNIGPASINLASLSWPSEITSAIDKINDIAMALAVLFIIAICLAGIGMLLMAGLAAGTSTPRRAPAVGSVVVGSGAALFFFIGSLVITIGANKAASAISEVGDHGWLK